MPSSSPDLSPVRPASSPFLRTGLSKESALLLMAGFLPLTLVFLANLWGRPQYQFFPMALGGIWFLVRQRIQAQPLESGDGPVALGLLVAGFCMQAAGTVLWSPWLGAIALTITLLGLAWWAGGGRFFRAVLPVLLLVVTIIPPPFALDARLTLELRSIAVSWSSKMLDLMGIVHALSGNVIELPRQKLLVEEACSGINSVLLSLACCVFYLLWRKRSVFVFLVCLPATLVFVLLGNMIRIAAGAWIKINMGVDLLSGTPHEIFGLVLTVTYMVLIISLEHLLYWPPSPAAARIAATRQPDLAPPPQSRANLSPKPGWILGGAFALLGLAGLGVGWGHLRVIRDGAMASKTGLREGATFKMPEHIGDWVRLSSVEPEFHNIATAGISSNIWHYRNGNNVVAVGLDYPFRGYHDVTMCYTLAGWEITKKDRLASGPKGSPPLVEVEMRKAPIGVAELWFATVDEEKHWVEAPVMEKGISDRWQLPGGREPTTYRVQVLASGYGKMADAERESTREFFEQARELLSTQLFQQMKASK